MADDIDALVDWQLAQAKGGSGLPQTFEWRCSICHTTWHADETIHGCCPDSVLEIRCDDGEFRVYRLANVPGRLDFSSVREER